MSSFTIFIIACAARFPGSVSGELIMSTRTVGVICQATP